MTKVIIRKFDTRDYLSTWNEMKHFTDTRQAETLDEIWLLQHPPVFTQGLAGKPEHVLNLNQIPLVQTDRGGQVTYHGPGQLVVYVLFDLKRLNIGIRQLVTRLETTVIDLLKDYGISSQSRCDAPGVYVDTSKICSIGLRVRKGCAYHGIALNVNMDLAPFSYINPCGFQGLYMTQISHFVKNVTVDEVGQNILKPLMQEFGFTVNL